MSLVNMEESYHGVMSSVIEIVKKNQRHLFTNMLDLLARTTQSTGAAIQTYLTNDDCKFWYTEIIPLCFDSDPGIQKSAIDAIEVVLDNEHFYLSKFHNNPDWPRIKSNIVDNYTIKLNEMRNLSNSRWYQIWCILIRSLDQEIVRSASVINMFLSVVEQGFRSNDYQIRAEAFLCWKVLVEIFAKHNELGSPKRVKLISIPLRSSQAKTQAAALNKFVVWWCFLSKLNQEIYTHINITLEPFLQYCFGNNSMYQLKPYPRVKEMAAITFIEMLGQPNKEIHILLEKFELQRTDHIIINANIFNSTWKLIIKSSYEATLIIAEQCSDRKQLLKILWSNLLNHIIKLKNPAIYKECCVTIKELIKADYDNSDLKLKSNIWEIVEMFGTNPKFIIQSATTTATDPLNLNKITETILDFMEILLTSDHAYFDAKLIEPILKNIFNIMEFKESSKYWEILKRLIENVLESDNIDDFNNFEIKLAMWKVLSELIKSYLDLKIFEFRIEKKAALVNRWILWPLNKIKSLTNDPANLIDNTFMLIWKKLMLSASQAEGKSNFTLLLSEPMQQLCDEREKIPQFPDVLGCYIDCLDRSFDASSVPIEMFNMAKQVLLKPVQKNKKNNNIIVESLTNFLTGLNGSQIVLIFDNIKTLTKTLSQAEKSKYITKTYFETYKKGIFEVLKNNNVEKIYKKEFKNITKNDEEFTVIPTVWALNPEKLTDRQKEKMKEKKSDIPALYNDMSSRSQDSSSIKPWTPNKIVIAKSKNCEEILLPGQSEVIINSPKTDIFKMPNQRDDIITDEHNVVQESIPRINSKANTIKSDNKKSNKITEKDEALLKKMNINIDNEKTKIQVLRNLKSISIDTVEGKQLMKSYRNSLLKEDGTGIKTRKSDKVTSKRGRSQGSEEPLSLKKQRQAKKSLSFERDETDDQLFDSEKIKMNDGEEPETKQKPLENLEDEIVEASQRSESLITRRIRKTGIKSLSATELKNKPEPKASGRMKKMRNSISPTVEDNQSKIVAKKEEKLSAIDANITKEEKPLEINELKTNSNTNEILTDEIIIETNDQMPEMETQESIQIAQDTTGTNLLNDIQINTSINVKSPQSESGKELKNKIKKTKSPSNFMEIQNIENIVAEMDTQPMTEDIPTELIEPGSDLIEKNVEFIKVSEMDTQLNTQIFLSPVINICENNTRQPETETTPEKDASTSDLIKDLSLLSPVYSPIKAKSIVTADLSGLNKSIVTSPDVQNLDAKNAEFLNSTLNISPILTKSVDNETIENPTSELIEEKETDILDKQQLSPDRKENKQPQSALSSPPDRRQTYNATSPIPKTKHASNLTGRGAQFINMIRNRKLDMPPHNRILPSTIMCSKFDDVTNVNDTAGLLLPKAQQNTSPTRDENEKLTNNIDGTAHPEMLVFSKILPSPYASPSVSILKRKFRNSIDDYETPSYKRKRVSFHDPPVSATKQYVTHDDRDKHLASNRIDLNKFLQPEKTSTPQSAQVQNISVKHSLKRKSRADSMMEILKFNESPNQKDTAISKSKLEPVQLNNDIREKCENIGQISVDMETLKWNVTNDNSSSCAPPVHNPIAVVSEHHNNDPAFDEPSLTPSPSLYFSDEAAILKHVMDKYDLDDIVGKYLENGQQLANKTVRNLTKEISLTMLHDPKMRTNVLEMLSEKHSKEFLDHAIQENLSSVVCDRLNPVSVIEFVCEKSKINNGVRKIVLDKIQNILTIDKFASERKEFFNWFWHHQQMTNDEILEYIESMTVNRIRNGGNRNAAVESTSGTVDSSSTL